MFPSLFHLHSLSLSHSLTLSHSLSLCVSLSACIGVPQQPKKSDVSFCVQIQFSLSKKK